MKAPITVARNVAIIITLDLLRSQQGASRLVFRGIGGPSTGCTSKSLSLVAIRTLPAAPRPLTSASLNEDDLCP